MAILPLLVDFSGRVSLAACAADLFKYCEQVTSRERKKKTIKRLLIFLPKISLQNSKLLPILTMSQSHPLQVRPYLIPDSNDLIRQVIIANFTKLYSTQHRRIHKTAQHTSLHSSQNCTVHNTEEFTRLHSTHHCTLHKTAQYTIQKNAQNCTPHITSHFTKLHSI